MNICSRLSVHGRLPAFQRIWLLLASLASGLLFAPLAHAQTGMVSPSPSNCTIPGGSITCSSLISWTSSGTTAVEVWVSVNGGTETLFGSSGSGPDSENATWIQASMSYAFNLYDYSSGSRGSLLSTTTVTGSYSISLSWGNSSNSAITPNMVALDYWTLTISGAPPNAAIKLTATYDNGSPYDYTLPSTTTGSGTYSQTSQVTLSSVGIYTNSWTVGGIPAGPPSYNYEIIFTPGALSVYSSGATSPNCGAAPNASEEYGVLADITYTITTSGGTTVSEQDGGIPITPYFDYGTGKILVGNGFTGYWPSSYTANTSNGRFVYVPLGVCQSGAYLPYEWTSDTIYVKIGNLYYEVRSQTWTASSSSGYHGEEQNSVGDVTVTW